MSDPIRLYGLFCEISLTEGIEPDPWWDLCAADQIIWGKFYRRLKWVSDAGDLRAAHQKAIAACHAVVDANDRGMRAEEGRRAVELCRAVVADADVKGAR